MLTDVDALLDAISKFNLAYMPLPLAIVLLVIAFLVVALQFWSPSRYSKQVNIIVKAWMGLSFLLLVAFIMIVARSFSNTDAALLRAASIVYAVIGVFVLADIWWKRLDFTSEHKGPRQWLGLAIALSGLLLYPLTQLLTGLRYPRIVLYGSESMSLIYLIPLFGMARPIKSKIFRVIFAYLSLEAAIYGILAAVFQIWFDAYMALAGVFGIVSLVLWIKAERRQAKVLEAHPS
jgi:hypothetical protein